MAMLPFRLVSHCLKQRPGIGDTLARSNLNGRVDVSHSSVMKSSKGRLGSTCHDSVASPAMYGIAQLQPPSPQ